MSKTPEIHFRSERKEIEGIVVNPGEYFGRIWILQIAIANAINPFFAIESDCEQEAIDAFTDSNIGHLIKVDDEDIPTPEEEESSGYSRAGNAGDVVDLSRCHLSKAPKDIVYFLEWKPDNDTLSCDIESILHELREESGEEE